MCTITDFQENISLSQSIFSNFFQNYIYIYINFSWKNLNVFVIQDILLFSSSLACLGRVCRASPVRSFTSLSLFVVHLNWYCYKTNKCPVFREIHSPSFPFLLITTLQHHVRSHEAVLYGIQITWRMMSWLCSVTSCKGKQIRWISNVHQIKEI